MAEDSCQCYECSQKFKLEIKNWSLFFKSYAQTPDGKVDYDNLINPKSCISDNIIEFKRAFQVCTDFWGVTLIDKQTLIDIVAKKMGTEKATDTVESYIKENKSNLDIVKLTPGEYDFKFHGNYWKFNNKIQDESLPKDFEKFFSVSRKELNLDNKKIVKLKI